MDGSCLRLSKDLLKFASKVGFCTGYKNTISAAASCLTHRYESGIDLLIKLSETNQIPQNFKTIQERFFLENIHKCLKTSFEQEGKG